MAARSSGHHANCSKINQASPQPLTVENTTATASPTAPTLTSPSLPYSSEPHIPIYLIAKILARLPVKFLLRLRCICKSWNALISDPNFAKQQFRASPADPTRQNLVRRSSHAGPVPSRRRRRWLRHLSWVLPWHAMSRHRPNVSHFVEPLHSDSYKVVSVVTCRQEFFDAFVFETDVRVHTLGTDSWRQIQRFPSSYPVDGSGKFVGGALNWLAESDDVTNCSWFIVSLNLKTETYRRLLPPDCVDDVQLNLTTGVLRDCLCILVHDSMALDVWLMKDYGSKESWTKEFRVPYMSDYLNYCHYHRANSYYASALCVFEDGDEILLENEFKLVLYNSKSGTFKTRGVQKLGGGSRMVAEVYDENLISPC